MRSSMSLLLIGDNSFLRCLTYIQLFLNSDYYGEYCCFDLAFNSQRDKIRSLHYFFCFSLKSATLDHFFNDNIGAVKNDAILNCKDFEWSSFMCLLGLSSVLKGQILYYTDVSWYHFKMCLRIFFCCNEAFGTFVFVKSAKFHANYFLTIITHNPEKKKNNPSHTSSASKKNCLRLPKMESLASRFHKDKQSKGKQSKQFKLQIWCLFRARSSLTFK